MLSDMRDVIYDNNWLSDQKDVDLYYMYRDISFSEEDERIIEENRLRYDITVIPPGRLGVEYVKTYGHYHPTVCENMTYPELYEVLKGEAHYLLQRGKDKITDVIVIRAKEGDKVLIPPDYGHVTINPSDKTLVMSNWVCRDFSSIYDPIKEMGGAAYFELIDGSFIPNENYDDLPGIRFLPPITCPEVGLGKKPIYTLIREPSKLSYLRNPAGFSWLFDNIEFGSRPNFTPPL
jgi:glucose-6-phosphate isomerase